MNFQQQLRSILADATQADLDITKPEVSREVAGHLDGYTHEDFVQEIQEIIDWLRGPVGAIPDDELQELADVISGRVPVGHSAEGDVTVVGPLEDSYGIVAGSAGDFRMPIRDEDPE